MIHLRAALEPLTSRVSPLADGAIITYLRGHKVEDTVRLGPNQVHAFITHEDGSMEDLGVSHNLLITSSAGGRDQIAKAAGGFIHPDGSPNTAVNATSITATATPWTTNLLAGCIVVSNSNSSTANPVYGNIISNTNAVLTIDKWWDADETSGTTPSASDGFIVIPGAAAARYMAITENAGAASAASTALTGELTTGGCSRALATYAHTLASATYTLVKAYSVTATFPAIHKMGMFHTGVGTAGSMMFEAVLDADASVVNGDTLTVTDTVTVS